VTPPRSSEPQDTRLAGRVPRGGSPRASVITDANEVVLVTVIQAGDRVLKAFDAFFRPFGLTDAQYNVLRILEGAKEPLSQQALAKRLLVSRANVTSLIDKLEAQGLVQRCACEDRRVKLIQLTERGLAFVEETFAALQQICAALMRPFSPAEQRELYRLLHKLLGSTS
jgi:MarR family 2-MHQ and catechol resistance regulon transcriptional repressor